MSNSTEQEATNDLQGVVDRNADEAEVEQNEKAGASSVRIHGLEDCKGALMEERDWINCF